MKTGASIQKATLDMCCEIAEVKRQVWETTYRGIYPDGKLDNFSVEKETEKFRSIVNSADTNLYVAIVEDRIVGYMAYGKNPRYPDADCDEIVLLSVLKEWQGQGIGKALFEFAKNQLQDMGDHFILYCNKYNLPAQAFYKRMGCKVLSVDDDNSDRSIPQIKFIYAF